MSNLQDSIKSFILHCIYEKKLSKKTQKCYEIDLAQFSSFLNEGNFTQSVEQIDRNILRAYIQSLYTFKPKTIKRKVATLKAFFNFLEFEDIIVVTPFRKLRLQIKEPKRLPTVLTTTEVQKIFERLYLNRDERRNASSFQNFELVRNISVVKLLFATGIRVSEASNLKIGCINLLEGFIKVIGKGDKERVIQICNKEVLSVITNYSYLALGFREQGIDCFFVNRLGKQLSEQSIRHIVKNVSSQAKLDKRITPHVFRHSIATLLLEEGVDIKYIQEILGHSSILTTQIYTHVNSGKQKAILSDKHPRRFFSMSKE